MEESRITRWVWYLCFLFCLLFFLAHFYIVGGGIHGDGVYYYATLRSLIFDKDLDLRNEAHFYAHSLSKFSKRPRAIMPDMSKPLYPQYTIGIGILWLPFFLIGHMVSYLLKSIGFNITTDGFSLPYEFFVCLGSMVYGAIGLILSYKFLKRFFADKIAQVSIIGIWFATSFFFHYATVVGLSTVHMCSFFIVTLFFYLYFLDKRDKLFALFTGLTAALLFLVRPSDILFLAIPLINFFIEKKERKNIVYHLIVFFLALLAIIFQMYIYSIIFGKTFDSPYFEPLSKAGYLHCILQPEILKTLFYSSRGLFTWTPITLPAVLGLIWYIKKYRMALHLFLGFLIQVWFVSSYMRGLIVYGLDMALPPSSFGMRFLISSSLMLMFGLAAALELISRKVKFKLIILIVGLFSLWNILLVFQFLLETFDINKPVNLFYIFLNQFTIIFKVIKAVFLG